MSAAAIEARGWGWRHAGRRAFAVRGLDLAIEPGERVLLLGASGSGKSTLLAGLAGVLGGDEDGHAEGELRVLGGDPADRRGHAGLVLQDPDAQMIMARAGDDTAFGPENLGLPRDEIWRRVAAAQEAVGLRLARDRATEALSGGQKQRLALAGVLALRPRLLLLDEPTANLDPAGAVEVRDAVARVLDETGATAVIVEHRVDLWWSVATRVVVLDPGGGLLADGRPDAVLAAHAADLAAAGVWLPGGDPLRLPAPPAPGPRLLSARDLAVARVPGTPVSHDIHLEVAAGEVLGLTGANGAGKSTLALTLGGLLPPAAGRVVASSVLAGGESDDPWSWRSRRLLSRIGSVFQNPEHQFVARTVREELAVGPRALRLGDRAIVERVDRLLDRLGLGALAGASPFSLSGGQKRRLSVGTALATEPRLLVLDEPTFGQDARGWAGLVELLDGLRREGAGIVAATHDEEVLAALGARRLVLGPGADAAVPVRQTGVGA